MARIESKQSGGAFPLPLDWAEMLFRLWKPFEPAKGRRAILCDPFANTGEAALLGAGMLNMEPYMVELNDQYIEQGREKMSRFYRERNMHDYSLTRYLHDDSFNVEMSNGSVSLYYCNPPFDDMLVTSEQHSVEGLSYGNIRQRFELTAVRNGWKYLSPGGYMVAVMYSQHMTRKMIKTFRENCDNVMVLRAPEAHLDHYTLVFVIGNYLGKDHVKLAEGSDEALKVEEWFMGLGKAPESITPIDKMVNYLEKKGEYLFPSERNGVAYPAIPALNIYRGSILFESKQTDAGALLELNRRHGAHTLPAFAALCKPTQEAPLIQPVHRPNKNQISVNIAGGMLDNLELMRKDKKALLRGSVRELVEKIGQDEEQVYSKEGSYTRIHETSLIRPDHHIMLLYQDGSIEDLSGAEALKEVIAENAVLLVDTFNEKYKPFYDMKVHATWRKLLNGLHPGGIQTAKFFRAQRYIIVCTIEHMAIRHMQLTNAQQGSGKSPMNSAAMIGLRLLHLGVEYYQRSLALNSIEQQLLKLTQDLMVADNPWAEQQEERKRTLEIAQRAFELPVPAIAKRFGITGEDLIALVDDLCQRYGVKPEALTGIPVDQPVLVGVPAIAPSIWLTQETVPLYEGFRPMQLFNAGDVDKFMAEASQNEDDTLIYLGVVSYESAKSNEGREPAAMARTAYSRGWEQTDLGPKNVIKRTKKPIDPITGGVVVNAKGEEMPWKHMTKEGRRKTLDFFIGREFYGYASEVVTLEDGKKEYRINWKKPLYSVIIPATLSRDQQARNDQLGYPYYKSRQYPLFSEIRNFGKPKIGNGLVDTPDRVVKIPGKTMKQIKFTRDGYRCAPYLADVVVKPKTYITKDYKRQKNLTGAEILDPWLWAQGTRYLEESGKRDTIDKAMRKAGKKHYRVGGGNRQLDDMLKKRGMIQYQIGVGQIAVRNPRYPVANYVRRFYKGKIALFIADEIHLAKGGSTTEIGAALMDFIIASKMSIGLTGTLYGGKASSVFALAYLFSENVRKRYRWARGAPMEWIEDMGVRKLVETRDVGSPSSIRSGRKAPPRITEAPGASPLLQVTLSPICLWASLADLGDKMPDKQELSYAVEFEKDERSLYTMVMQVLKEYNAKQIVQGDRSFLAPLYQNGLCLSDAMHRPWNVYHNIKKDKGAARKKAAEPEPVLILEIPSIGLHLHSKEKEVLEWLRKDLADGRRVIITLNQTESRDIRGRWMDIITENIPEAKAFILHSSSPKASDRSSYIKKMAGEGFNVMITNGGLIATAISINKFSAMYAVEYAASLYSFSQYMARINRPNQERDDIVYRYFFHIESKYQHEAIQNIADKTRAASVLAGSEGGDLAAMMSSEIRVQTYSMITEAIESGRAKLKSAEEIQEAFKSSTFNSGNWSSSAWYVEGDDLEDGDSASYEESEIVVEYSDDEEPEVEEMSEFAGFDDLFEGS